MKHALLIIFLLLIACQPTKIDNIRYETGALSNITQHTKVVHRIIGRIIIPRRVPDGCEFDFSGHRYRSRAYFNCGENAIMQITEYAGGRESYILVSLAGQAIGQQCWRCPE